MNKKLPKWIKNAEQDLIEFSQDISIQARKLYHTASKTLSQLKNPKVNTNPTRTPSPQSEVMEMRRQMDLAISSCYYSEGGFRHFGGQLQRYVKVVLPTEQSLTDAWIAGYNTIISPMLRQGQRLEKKLESLSLPEDPDPSLNQQELLDLMRHFKALAYAKRLYEASDWTLEDYRQALQQYAQELDEKLLLPYPDP